jgi:hypothetical protein
MNVTEPDIELDGFSEQQAPLYVAGSTPTTMLGERVDDRRQKPSLPLGNTLRTGPSRRAIFDAAL